MKNRLLTEQMTEIALLISMALVIEIVFMAFPGQPQGGSISVSLIPLVVIAWRHGLRTGIYAGIIFGILNLLLAARLYHWASLFLDYIFAFGVVGIAALFARINRRSAVMFALSLFVVGALRFLFHFISGAVLFGEWAPEGQGVWEYSLVYNTTYMVPTIILIILVGVPVFIRLKDQIVAQPE